MARFVPLLALAAAGCFTDPINHKPSVTINGPDPQVVSRQQTAKFRADANDSDGDAIQYQWAFQDHECMPDDPPDSWGPSTPDPTAFMVTASQTNGPFCVWVMATDAHNATDIKYLSVDPVDQPPKVQINVVSPDPAMHSLIAGAYALYSTFELSSDGTSDPEGDALDYRVPAWVLQVPAGSTSTIQPCTSAAAPSTSSGAPHQCFYADVPGDYAVSLTVFDSQGQPGMTMRSFHVNEDRLPCIGATDPGFTPPTTLVRDPSMMQMIVINSVDDDGSPYPQTFKATFSWFLSVNDSDWQFYSNGTSSSPVFILPAGGYRIGDNVKVRVEVSDGTPKAAAVLALCDSNEDFCPPNSDTACYQRATWSYDFR